MTTPRSKDAMCALYEEHADARAAVAQAQMHAQTARTAFYAALREEIAAAVESYNNGQKGSLRFGAHRVKLLSEQSGTRVILTLGQPRQRADDQPIAPGTIWIEVRRRYERPIEQAFHELLPWAEECRLQIVIEEGALYSNAEK